MTSPTAPRLEIRARLLPGSIGLAEAVMAGGALRWRQGLAAAYCADADTLAAKLDKPFVQGCPFAFRDIAISQQRLQLNGSPGGYQVFNLTGTGL